MGYCDRVQWKESGFPLDERWVIYWDIMDGVSTYRMKASYSYIPTQLSDKFLVKDGGESSTGTVINTMSYSRQSWATHSMTDNAWPPSKCPPGGTGNFIIGSG